MPGWMGRQLLLEDLHASLPAPVGQGAAPGFRLREGHVEHPLLKPATILHREYQLRVARRAVAEDLLVVLPTGLGKTVIAALASAEFLAGQPATKVLVLAPTRPLVLQHARFWRDALTIPPGSVVALTGQEAPNRRRKSFNAARVIVSTPQGLQEDLASGRIHLGGVSLLVVDEAHRAVGDYDYVPVVDVYRDQSPDGRILGLTASPGGQKKRVDEVLRHLGNPAVESLTEGDAEVAQFLPGVAVERRDVEFDARLEALREPLRAVLKERLGKLRAFLPASHPRDFVPKTQLLRIGDAIRKRLGKPGRARGFLFACLINQGAAVETNHCLELLETQGVAPLRDYVVRLAGSTERTRSQASFLKDGRVQDLVKRLEVASGPDLVHPKEPALVAVLGEHLGRAPSGRAIVFAQYRDTVRRIVDVLRSAGIRSERFVGQADRDADAGLDQQEQGRLLRRFERGDFPVLVATSVAEEGLHVPSVDLVVFYEPLVSEIRTIQRRGRTGRTSVGRVVILSARTTRDERHASVEAVREAGMRKIVRELQTQGLAGRP